MLSQALEKKDWKGRYKHESKPKVWLLNFQVYGNGREIETWGGRWRAHFSQQNVAAKSQTRYQVQLRQSNVPFIPRDILPK